MGIAPPNSGDAPDYRRAEDFEMPSSAKDLLSEAGSSAGSTGNEVQGSQPSAAGAEIPVTLHASRYSATSKGGAKLPPIHEETRTVIIFPQGAVVRLSASVTPGELVVLTNNRTGTDVVCRVTSVKTQPGIQNYVHLEFTQRALDFWEGASSSERGTASAKTPVATTPAAVPPTRTPVASTNKTAPSLLKDSVSDSEVEAKIPAPLPKITPLADLPAAGASDTSAKIPDARAQASEFTPYSAPTQKKPRAAVADIPRFQPFESAVARKPRKSKSIILVAMAAAVLLAMGIVAGPELWQRYGRLTLSQKSSVAATPAPPSVPLVPVQSNPPAVKSSLEANPVEPFVSTSVKNPPAERPVAESEPVRPAPEPVKPEPQRQPVIRPALNVGKISAPKSKKAAQVNSNEPPPVLSGDAGALPAAIGESVGTTISGANALPAPQPAAPAPPKGGDLQQPKLLSSVAAAYPPLARAQRVQGDVTIDALIDVNGKVSATKVLNGNLLLQNAAIDALRLWKYQPARLNGEPIPIHINVTIAFHLN
jgi:periplasmic protein TonB